MAAFRLLIALPLALLLTFSAHARDASTVVPAPVEDTGTIDGAPYRIDIPADWNGELVVLAHGFEPVGVPRATPWPANDATAVFLSVRYAVAQSGYRTQGWAIRDGIMDTEAVRSHFVARHGLPSRTWLVGFSMGGGIAVASLEQHPAQYDGALSLCGANVPGTVLAEDLFTTLVAVDALLPAVAQNLGGRLSDPYAPANGQVDVMSAVAAALETAPDIASHLAGRLQVPAAAVPGIVSLHTLVFRDLKLRSGGVPVDNRQTRYTGFGNDAAFNAVAPRYAGDAPAMAYVANAPALSGHLDKPLVLQYNADDPTIAPRFQSVYAALAQRTDGIAPVVLPDTGEGHCGFSQEQIALAFDVLTRWATTGQRPAEP